MLRFAILQTAFIGDVALSLPLTQAIRNDMPTAEITVVTTNIAAPLVGCAAAVDEVTIFDKRGKHGGLKGLAEFAAELRRRNYDYMLSPHRSMRSALLARLAWPKISVGFSTAAWPFLYDKTVKYRVSYHETERILSLLEAVEGISHQPHAPEVDIEIPAGDVEFAEQLWKQAGIGNTDEAIAVAPGSIWETKCWPKQYYEQAVHIIRQNGFRVVMIGSNEDAPLCEEIAAATGSISFAGKTTLPQTLHILRRCRVVLANDSAPIHLARLVKTPSAAIFGPTSPQFGFAPSGDYDRIIENPHLACRPCAIHGGRKCPIGTLECMKSLSPRLVADTVFQIIKAVPGHSKK